LLAVGQRPGQRFFRSATDRRASRNDPAAPQRLAGHRLCRHRPGDRPPAPDQSPGQGQARGRAAGGQAGCRGGRGPAPRLGGPDGGRAAGRLAGLAQASGKPISPHTVNDYRGLIERKLKPGLGKLRLAQLDTQRLDRFYGELRKTGNSRNGGGALSESRVRDIHAIMSGALGLAARFGWIAFNPALLARPPAQQSTTRTVPTAQEVRELLAAAAAEPDLELYLRLAATTGLRPGELCALRWVDVALEAAEVRVTGNVVHAKGLDGGYVRKPPKSVHGVRVLALDPGTVELLAAQHHDQALRQAGRQPRSAFHPVWPPAFHGHPARRGG
jgi:integrase